MLHIHPLCCTRHLVAPGIQVYPAYIYTRLLGIAGTLKGTVGGSYCQLYADNRLFLIWYSIRGFTGPRESE
jgi:hypothetical protein